MLLQAELAEQHAEEASEAAASCKQALEAAHATAPEAASTSSMPADPQHAQQHHQQLQQQLQQHLLEQRQLQEMLQTHQKRSLDLEKHCADMQRVLDALPSSISGLNAEAQHAQQAHVQELATHCTAVQHQIENLQVQLDSEAHQHAGLQQQQQAQHQQLASQHDALLQQLSSVQSSADSAAHQQQQQHRDLVTQQSNLQEQLKAVQAQAQTTAVQQQQQEQQQQQSLSQEASGLHAIADVHKQQLMSLQEQVASVQRASEAASNRITTSSAGWQEVQQQVHGLQAQVDASKETQAELHVSVLLQLPFWVISHSSAMVLAPPQFYLLTDVGGCFSAPVFCVFKCICCMSKRSSHQPLKTEPVIMSLRLGTAVKGCGNCHHGNCTAHSYAFQSSHGLSADQALLLL